PRLGRRALSPPVGLASGGPTAYRQAPGGRLAPALAGINPAPHTDPARGRHRAPIPSPRPRDPAPGHASAGVDFATLWGRLHAGRRSIARRQRAGWRRLWPG